jgi:trans-aconitate methyltransferase
MRDIEKYQQDYTLHFGFEEVLVAFRRRVLLESLARIAPRVVVEIGCGPERTYAHHMERAGPVDQWLIVEPAAAWFEQAAAAGLPGQSAIHGFFEARVAEVRSALVSPPDVVVCSGVMPEVESAPALLAAVRSIMGPETVLFVNAPNWASFHRRLAVAMKLAARPDEPSERNALLQQRRIYDAASFREELGASGFDVIREGGYFVKPFTNDQMAAIQGALGQEVLEGLFELGRQHPDWAAELFCEARIRAETPGPSRSAA